MKSSEEFVRKLLRAGRWKREIGKLGWVRGPAFWVSPEK
jgi:hypothetical protein